MAIDISIVRNKLENNPMTYKEASEIINSKAEEYGIITLEPTRRFLEELLTSKSTYPSNIIPTKYQEEFQKIFNPEDIQKTYDSLIDIIKTADEHFRGQDEQYAKAREIVEEHYKNKSPK